MNNPVSCFEIYVDDMPRAKQFYEQVFEVSLTLLPAIMENGPEMWAWPMVEDGAGAGGAKVSDWAAWVYCDREGY